MKTLSIAIAATLIGSAAFAQSTTVIHREGGMGGDTTVVKRHSDDGDVTTRRVETDSAGCSTKSVTRTNDEGDRVTKTKSDC